jgi:hypothetical protein
LSVGDVIKALSPDGYFDHQLYLGRQDVGSQLKKHPPKRHTSWTNPPCSAVDLFALAGSLLTRSGAYHHVSPEVPSMTPQALTVKADDREGWVNAGRSWRGDGQRQLPTPPPTLLEAWAVLYAHLDEPIFRESKYSEKAHVWWRAALSLFVIADEAALNLGFETADGKSAQAAYVEFRARKTVALRGTISFSSADKDQVCVLPKSRTPKVGCTIRSLSHNLALLPGRGMARAYWRLAPSVQPAKYLPQEHPFNVVIVPTPYRIHASAFKGHAAADASWGWFGLAPHWCPASQKDNHVDGFDEFLAFIEALLIEAEADVGTVHALILPEVALSGQVFRKLCAALQTRPEFELLVSGLFDYISPTGQTIREGNFTGMARFGITPAGVASFDISIREKHHRWRIEKSQIESYALGSALDVNRGWWERIDILSRSIDVFVLRGGATVTTLICEDLARSDPCQELVRGIGPNFVVALLMDGPQMTKRWPARYATVLAEDPGSSVLTLTSFGLIKRGNDTGRFPPAQQIGLFQDDSGLITEIQLAPGAQAMCITLQPSRIRERTLDGRDDNHGAQSWKLSGVNPVTISEPNAAILTGHWPTGPV